MIVMTLLVRDEADILRANIEYHRAQGVDHFIIMDNLSVDETPEIAREYVAAGIATYIAQREDDYSQSDWVTGMARMAFDDHRADWVINNDADEFWWPMHGTLAEALQRIGPEFNTLVAQRHNFVAVDGDAAVLERMIWRQTVSLNSLGLPLPSKMAHRGHPDIVVAQGNHSVTGFARVVPAPGAVEILHFPVRTLAQVQNKIGKGGAAYDRNTRLDRGVGLTWRRLYDEFREKGGLGDYYALNLYDEARLGRELAGGSIVRDTRLRDFMREVTLTAASD